MLRLTPEGVTLNSLHPLSRISGVFECLYFEFFKRNKAGLLLLTPDSPAVAYQYETCPVKWVPGFIALHQFQSCLS
jgi:hypothetical protein